MIAESPNTLVLLLVALTLLGAVMGYCVAMIIAKRQASKAIEASRLELVQDRLAAKSELQTAKHSLSGLRSSVRGESDDNSSMSKREKSLESQSQIQAKRIENLEAELSTLEGKQLSLRRNFASYKASKSRELEQLRRAAGPLADTANLPTLSRKVDHQSSSLRVDQSLSMSERVALGSPFGNRETRSYSSSREIDIPALAESELEGSDDVLDLDVSGAPSSGARGRG